MTRRWLGIAGGSVLALLVGWALIPHDHWYVKPVEGGKWTECLERRRWDGTFTGCGGPMSLDEATWWMETKGGTVVR